MNKNSTFIRLQRTEKLISQSNKAAIEDIKELASLISSKEIKRQIIQISSRFHGLRQQEIAGTIDIHQNTILKNQIWKSLIEVFDDLKSELHKTYLEAANTFGASIQAYSERKIL